MECFFFYFFVFVDSAEIAKELPEDSYGLIFGINTFIAYCSQTLLTIIVASDLFELNLSIFDQFNVYASFYTFLGSIYFLFMVMHAAKLILGEKSKIKHNLTNVNTISETSEYQQQ